MSPSEFWEMTIYEVMATIEATVWREEQTHKLALTAAWFSAALSRQKRMPGLRQFLLSTFPSQVGRKEDEKRRRDFLDITKDLDVADLSHKIALKRKRKL